MGVQVSEFACGSVAVGACISHRVCDGTTMASFLREWSETAATGDSCGGGPVMTEGAGRFPARSMRLNMTGGMTGERDIVTRRMTGNLWQVAVSPMVEIEKSKEIEVQELAQVVKKTIRKIDGDYVRKLEGKDGELGVYEVLKSLKEAMFLVAEKGIPCYSFSSWIRFEFYETQFGWGKPTWACTIGVPIRNVVVLMPTKCGEGIEAWVTLNHLHMAQFEKNPYLLQFASFDP
ncbi:vinorine synthase-like [Senna tora]|uniref:Vinorine synthase-like n=1 Tax=Senna tora TaxID=362788 RepID=A0A834TX67_9FABA|nr:vinorine synthase-like [Senna tora]